MLRTAGPLWVFVAIAAGTSLYTWWRRGAVHPGARLAVAAGIFYSCGMFLIYLSTPYDLYWHLSTSAFRTMAVVRIGMIVTVYFCLTQLEQAPITTPVQLRSRADAPRPIGYGEVCTSPSSGGQA